MDVFPVSFLPNTNEIFCDPEQPYHILIHWVEVHFLKIPCPMTFVFSVPPVHFNPDFLNAHLLYDIFCSPPSHVLPLLFPTYRPFTTPLGFPSHFYYLVPKTHSTIICIFPVLAHLTPSPLVERIPLPLHFRTRVHCLIFAFKPYHCDTHRVYLITVHLCPKTHHRTCVSPTPNKKLPHRSPRVR